MLTVRAKSKYGNRKTEVDGIVFDSAMESRRYRELCVLVRAGHITDLTLQPSFLLIPAFRDSDGKNHRETRYIADFGYRIGDQECVEDVKGAVTRIFALKEKLLLSKYPQIRFRVVRGC